MPTIPVAKPGDALRAADQLLRSGAFGFVVLDLDAGRYQAPLAVQVRLANLCQRHEATLLCLTGQKAFALASLRGQGQRRRDSVGYRCTIEVGKDKKHGREWEWSEVCRGPVGMR